jgi:hypothetical protein
MIFGAEGNRLEHLLHCLSAHWRRSPRRILGAAEALITLPASFSLTTGNETMAIQPHQKLALLAEVNELYRIFLLCNSDTGFFRGSDTGASTRSSRVHADRCRVILNGHTEHALEGWYVSSAALLTLMGA